MLISTKGRYAVRVMLSLAAHKKEEYLTLNAIATEQAISEKYLESIVALLAKAGLVEGVRGKGGGYRLSREPKDYNLLEILSVSEGSISPVSCLECKPNPCANAGACKTLPVWERLQIVIDDFLRGVTLESVLTDGVAENAADGEKGQAAEKKVRLRLRNRRKRGKCEKRRRVLRFQKKIIKKFFFTRYKPIDKVCFACYTISAN